MLDQEVTVICVDFKQTRFHIVANIFIPHDNFKLAETWYLFGKLTPKSKAVMESILDK